MDGDWRANSSPSSGAIMRIRKPYQVPKVLARHRQHIQSIQARGPSSIHKLLEVMAETLQLSLRSVSTPSIGFSRLKLLDLSMSEKLVDVNAREITSTFSCPVMVLHHCPNLIQLTIPGMILEQNPVLQRLFLFALGTKLPCLRRFIAKCDALSIATEVCLNFLN
jgi:hypothetical protein